MKQVITTEKIPIKIWADTIEDEALNQAKNLANLPFAFKHIALMPDVHSGYGMPIGGVMATKDVVIPYCVGLDIACGMLAQRTDLNVADLDYEDGEIELSLKDWLGKIREIIPVGFKHNDKPQEDEIFDNVPDIPIIQQELQSAKKQLCSLGSGNHFIEIQRDEQGYLWIMIHSGSRNLGKKVADFYHNVAKQLCNKWYSNISTLELAFLPMDTQEGKEYFEAMNFCMKFSYSNRIHMLSKIADIIGKDYFTGLVYNIHHNYAVMENHFGQNVLVHRKGATLAREGTIGIIPGSMGTNSYIVRGLGNPESFNSCSHGAGRRMGRAQATRELSLEEEQKKMVGIIGGPRTQSELDEAPGAYKDVNVVMEQQIDLVEIVTKLTPLAVIKG
jgi:tRNA-splicing ligase RtcB